MRPGTSEEQEEVKEMVGSHLREAQDKLLEDKLSGALKKTTN